MRLPNGYGTVYRLSGNRRRPYAVAKWITEDGKRRRRIIGYAETRQEGLRMLAEFNERPWSVDMRGKTFEEVYELWHSTTKLAASTVRSYESKYRCYCQKLMGMPYSQLRARHFQEVIDNCGKSNGTKRIIRKLFRQLDKTALEYEVIEKGYTQFVTAPEEEASSRRPFTEDEIKALWASPNTCHAKLVLVYLYTGFRRNELAEVRLENVDLSNWTIMGGSKTKAGTDRIVPIHKRLRPIVKELVENAREKGYETLFGISGKGLADRFSRTMAEFGMDHVIHECRHTLRTRLDNAKANKRCIDLIMGHSTQDVGERVYTHKTIEQLHEAINSIE